MNRELEFAVELIGFVDVPLRGVPVCEPPREPLADGEVTEVLRLVEAELLRPLAPAVVLRPAPAGLTVELAVDPAALPVELAVDPAALPVELVAPVAGIVALSASRPVPQAAAPACRPKARSSPLQWSTRHWL